MWGEEWLLIEAEHISNGEWNTHCWNEHEEYRAFTRESQTFFIFYKEATRPEKMRVKMSERLNSQLSRSLGVYIQEKCYLKVLLIVFFSKKNWSGIRELKKFK